MWTKPKKKNDGLNCTPVKPFSNLSLYKWSEVWRVTMLRRNKKNVYFIKITTLSKLPRLQYLNNIFLVPQTLETRMEPYIFKLALISYLWRVNKHSYKKLKYWFWVLQQFVYIRTVRKQTRGLSPTVRRAMCLWIKLFQLYPLNRHVSRSSL